MSISNDDAAEIVERLRRRGVVPLAYAEQAVWEQTESQQAPQDVVVSPAYSCDPVHEEEQLLKDQRPPWETQAKVS